MSQDAERANEAANPSTDPARLVELAQDEALAPLVAQNPNAPREVLLALAARVPEAVARNQALALWALEPDWLRRVPLTAALDLLRVCPLPGELLWVLWDRPEHTLRAALAAHPSVPEPLLERCLEDASGLVLLRLAENPSASPALLQRLAEAPEELPATRRESAISGLFGRILGQRAASILERTQGALGGLTRHVLFRQRLRAVARHPNCPAGLREALRAHTDDVEP